MKNVIVITGASSGIGKEFAELLDKKISADEIWAIARRKEKLEELGNILKTPVKPVSLDLSDVSNVKIYKDMLEAEEANVKMLVNCSGYGKFNHYENISPEVNQNMIDLNVKAVVAMTDATLPHMEKGGKIINIASCAAFQPIPYINIYAATKAFVLSYTRALNVELKYKNITATAVCPYWTKTEFFDRAVVKDEKTVIINYGVMYDPKEVVLKAFNDAMKGKDVSVYGGTNNFQRFLTKILPHKLVMKVWCRRQKFNGTPDIR